MLLGLVRPPFGSEALALVMPSMKPERRERWICEAAAEEAWIQAADRLLRRKR